MAVRKTSRVVQRGRDKLLALQSLAADDPRDGALDPLALGVLLLGQSIGHFGAHRERIHGRRRVAALYLRIAAGRTVRRLVMFPLDPFLLRNYNRPANAPPVCKYESCVGMDMMHAAHSDEQGGKIKNYRNGE